MGHNPWGHTELDTTEAAQHIGTCPRFTEEKTGSWRLTSKARKRNPGLSALRPGEGRLQLEDCLGCVTCPSPPPHTTPRYSHQHPVLSPCSSGQPGEFLPQL